MTGYIIPRQLPSFFFFFFNDTATTEIYTLSLHDALPIYGRLRALARPHARARGARSAGDGCAAPRGGVRRLARSEEHTSELQSRLHLVCRLLLEKKKKITRLTLLRKWPDNL